MIEISYQSLLSGSRLLGVLGTSFALIGLIGIYYFGGKVSQERKTRIITLEDEKNDLKKELENVRDYNDIAQMNLYGSKFLYPNQPGNLAQDRSPLVDCMKNVFISRPKDSVEIVHTDESLEQAMKAIEIEPRFPFSYYVVMQILKGRNNEEWRDYGNKCMTILEKTTNIKGHKNEYSNVKEILSQILE